MHFQEDRFKDVTCVQLIVTRYYPLEIPVRVYLRSRPRIYDVIVIQISCTLIILTLNLAGDIFYRSYYFVQIPGA